MPRPVAVILLAALVLAASCSVLHRSAGGTTTTKAVRATTTTLILPGSPTPVDDVLPGQCFNPLPDPAQQPFAVLAIGCEVPHTYQVYDRFMYHDSTGRIAPKSEAYPGDTTVRTTAEQQCYANFSAWMGISWTKSNYDIATWWPSAASWPKADRSITCAVYRYNDKLTVGSVADSKK